MRHPLRHPFFALLVVPLPEMQYLTLPLVLACFAFLAGLLPGLRFGGPPLVLAAGAGVVLALTALLPGTAAPPRRDRTGPLLLLAFVLAGAALGAAGRSGAAADCRARLPDGAPVTVRGVLAANRMEVAEEALAPLLPVKVLELRAGRAPVPGCGGEVRVRLPEGAPPLRAGTELTLRGQWARSAPPVVPSAWPGDPGFAGVLVAKGLTVQAHPRLGAHPLLTLRGRTEAHLYRIFPRHGALADALLLGRREGLDPEVKERFTRSGLVHLLAISGSHVALLAGALLLLGRVFRAPRAPLAWGTIALVALYLAVIGAPASAVRAGIMVALALLATLLQRPSASLPVVSAAALVILAVHPLAALDAGFQLSFAGRVGSA